MKQTNTEVVFRLIRLHGSISRAEIAKMTKLSPATISTIVDELIKKRMVFEKSVGQAVGAGRKPIMLELSEAHNYIIGMEINENGVSGTVFNLKSKPVKTIHHYFSNIKEKLAGEIVSVISELIGSVGPSSNIIGIGIGVPAVLDPEKRTILLSTPLQVGEMDLYNLIYDKFKIPTYIENESLLAGLAEKHLFVEKPNSFAYLSINKGFGASVFMNGEPLKGSSDRGVEIGHMCIDRNGPECLCGNRGCIDLFVTIHALIRTTLFHLSTGQATKINELTGGDLNRINEDIIAEALSMNDEIARNIVEEIALNLSYGVINVINIFDPEVVVIGGRLATLGQPLLRVVQEHVSRRALKPFAQSTKIVLARNDKEAISNGASIYVLDKVMEHHL